MIHQPGRLAYIDDNIRVLSPSAAGGGVPAWAVGGYAAYDFIGAASYAEAKLDLTGNLRHATDGTAYPTWANGVGCTFNGSTQYLVAPIILQSAWSILVKYDVGANTGARSLWGANGNVGGRYYLLYPALSGALSNIYHGNTTSPSIAINTSGTYGIADRRVFLDGSYTTSLAAASASNTSTVIYIGAFNNNPTAIQFLAGVITSFIVYDETRSDAQMLATSAAMP